MVTQHNHCFAHMMKEIERLLDFLSMEIIKNAASVFWNSSQTNQLHTSQSCITLYDILSLQKHDEIMPITTN